jgi:putative oxidoreductase
MMEARTAPYAAPILRVTLGVLFLLHAGLKIFVFIPAGTAQFFTSIGLPAGLAYLVIIWESVGGIALILGIWTSVAALILIPILLGAIFTVHGAAGFFFNNPNGGWEYPAFGRSCYWCSPSSVTELMHCVHSRFGSRQARPLR